MNMRRKFLGMLGLGSFFAAIAQPVNAHGIPPVGVWSGPMPKPLKRDPLLFEYAVITHHFTDDIDVTVAKINAMAKEEWRVYSVTSNAGNYCREYLMERLPHPVLA